jgi:catechol 2,3-dioxygenase-like lactoylglutathione lyase family enzyme
MSRSLAYVALLVRDYDDAIAYFTGKLGWLLLEDTPVTATKRWVRVVPSAGAGSGLLLARAVGPEQEAAVGRQGGGRVFGFVHTDDFRADHRSMVARGVRFEEPPREEPYGTVAVFRDLYGNRWDLIGPREAEAP